MWWVLSDKGSFKCLLHGVKLGMKIMQFHHICHQFTGHFYHLKNKNQQYSTLYYLIACETEAFCLLPCLPIFKAIKMLPRIQKFIQNPLSLEKCWYPMRPGTRQFCSLGLQATDGCGIWTSDLQMINTFLLHNSEAGSLILKVTTSCLLASWPTHCIHLYFEFSCTQKCNCIYTGEPLLLLFSNEDFL